MRKLGPNHGCDYSDYLKNDVYIPAHEIATMGKFYKEEGELMIYTDADAHDEEKDAVGPFKT